MRHLKITCWLAQPCSIAMDQVHIFQSSEQLFMLIVNVNVSTRLYMSHILSLFYQSRIQHKPHVVFDALPCHLQ
jgi:hypothetical protein